MPMETQGKIVRALHRPDLRAHRRESSRVKVDVRVLATTNQ